MRILTLALLLALTAGLAAAAETRPNIVLIMADDLGYECLSCNGSNTYKTPRLDAMAKGGTRFLHCHSQPICTPSRVQIMTGIYNNRNYVRFGLLDPQATTFAHLLKKAGYATCIVGKWQLSGGFDAPGHFGFDEYCLWQLTRRPSRYANPGVETGGKEVDYKDGEYGPDIVSDYLCDFIERHKDGPFLAYYPMILPHWPFEPTPDGPDYDKTSPGKKGVGEMKYFGEMVTYTDKIVGKIVDKLDALGIRDNTLVLFTGDNGVYTGITSKLDGRPYQGGKGCPRDNGTHVPLVASWPGTVPKAKVSDALIDFSDVLPTLCELGGAKVPAALDVDGTSFLPLLQGKPLDGRRWIYCWYERNGRRGKESQHTRNRGYKLYADGRFHNVVDDFTEQQPIDVTALTDELRPIHAELKASLDEALKTTATATEIINERFPPKKPKK
ncbi:MAG: sulfatase-like hydrolase/transferase [Candidatus Nealsonbacteria bacterium]|nr:sulfatase-like hydrolase/transferase [Candidatus Nealsonbacteria bacterium]